MNKPTETRIYLGNKDLLLEIQRSKLTFCSYEKEEDGWQDAIVTNRDQITDELIHETKITKAEKMTSEGRAKLRAAKAKAKDIKDFKVDPETIKTEDLVFRVMVSEHVPLDPHRKRRGTGENSKHRRTNFLPFKHYRIIDGELVEVLRSHWKGTIEDGEFCMTHGQITDNLVRMYMLLITRYSGRHNWRGYSYIDEMRDVALTQLLQEGLQFNEAVGSNPFSFFTTTLTNSFTRVFNLEKKQQTIRDDLLIAAGESPSFTRQMENEFRREHVTSPSEVTYVYQSETAKKEQLEREAEELAREKEEEKENERKLLEEKKQQEKDIDLSDIIKF